MQITLNHVQGTTWSLTQEKLQFPFIYIYIYTSTHIYIAVNNY